MIFILNKMFFGSLYNYILIDNSIITIMFLDLRENLAQIIQAGQRVIDNPVYISDLGTYLSFGACMSFTFF